MLYETIFRELARRKIRYLVIGGIAVNLHGFSRATADLDLMISFAKEDIRKFIELVKKVGWRPRVPVNLDDFGKPDVRERWIKEKGMKVFSIFNPKNEMEHIDIMVKKYLDFKKVYRDREVVHSGSLAISLMSIPDLIRLKRIAGRERDKIDIHALKKILEIKREKKKRQV